MLVNIANVGRVYASPQSRTRTIVELNYLGSHDGPVYLEVGMGYEEVKKTILAAQAES